VFGVGARGSRPNRRAGSACGRREHEVTRGLRDGACAVATDQNREGALWGKRRPSVSSGCERGARTGSTCRSAPGAASRGPPPRPCASAQP